MVDYKVNGKACMCVTIACCVLLFFISGAMHYKTQRSVSKERQTSRPSSPALEPVTIPPVALIRSKEIHEKNSTNTATSLTQRVASSQPAIRTTKQVSGSGTRTQRIVKDSQKDRMRTVERVKTSYPETCSCEEVPVNKKSKCYSFTQKPYCRARKCKSSYTCVNYSTGITCLRRKLSTAVVPDRKHVGECKVKKVSGYGYSPYTTK